MNELTNLTNLIAGAGGLAFFVAMLNQLATKAIIANLKGDAWVWRDVAINLSSVALALLGAAGTMLLDGTPWDAPHVTAAVFTALAAAGLATLGYEGINNVMASVTRPN